MTYYVGNSAQTVLDGISKRYFYGLRRNDDGELFLAVLDQLSGGDENVVLINEQGTGDENYPDFEEGIDFLSGINSDHTIEYNNLRYPQFRWDGRSLLYYVEDGTGLLVQKISESFDYPDGISSPSYSDADEDNVLDNNEYTQNDGNTASSYS